MDDMSKSVFSQEFSKVSDFIPRTETVLNMLICNTQGAMYSRLHLKGDLRKHLKKTQEGYCTVFVLL